MIKRLLQKITTYLLPRICVGCNFISDDEDLDLCTDCRVNLPWLEARCYQCGLTMVRLSEAIICDKCQCTQPSFNRLCALFKYKPPLIKLIGGLKFGRQLYAGKLFGQLLTEAIQKRWYTHTTLPEVIIPVPLHIQRQRQRKRGYNQAVEIALPIAKALNIPLALNICRRVRYTDAQAQLNKSLRTRNLSAAFSINIENLGNYKHVAIVDDVVTTASTVRAVSAVLLAAGVESIDIWCVCRA